MKLLAIAAILAGVSTEASVELGQRDLLFTGVDECQRVNVDFSELNNGDVLDKYFYKYDNVVISVSKVGGARCVPDTAFVIDTSNPQEGCDAGEGDSDLFCSDCGKALIISEKDKKGCLANDCAAGGEILFHFYNPVQVMFLDLLDLDSSISYEITYGNFINTGDVSLVEGPDKSGDGALGRFWIGNSNVKQLKIRSEGSFAISKLSFRACPDGGITHGDPHFKTWGGYKFDYHGQCDLVLVKAPLALKGKGLDIHIRSKHMDFYSYIERAAVRIGDEVIEVGHDGVILNGNHVTDFTKNILVAGLPVTYSNEQTEQGRAQQTYKIFLSEKEYVLIKVFKEFMSVRVMGASMDHFEHATGILGDFYTGRMLGRDGVTLIRDPEEFGLEWQVNNEDGNLFRVAPEPQFPIQCLAPPSMDARKLSHSVTKEQAAEACKNWGEDQDSCIFDVMATGDLEMAGAF